MSPRGPGERQRYRARRYWSGHGASSKGTPSSWAARNGQADSRRAARASRTTSASPLARIFSACSGSVISPTAPVAIPADAHRGRQRHLVAGLERDRGRRVAAGGDVDEVDPVLLQQYAETPALLDVPATVDPVRAGDAHQQRRGVRQCRAHRVDHLEDEAGAVLEGAAVAVLPTVRDRREELVEEVAVGGVDLDGVEARRDGTPGGVGEGLHHLVDLLDRERRWCGVPLERDLRRRNGPPAAVLNRDGAGPRVPRAVGGRLPTGVGELDPDGRALVVHEADDPSPRLGLLLVPDARVLWRDAALGHDRRRLRHHQPEAAGGAGAEVHEVPVVRHAVDRGVLAHGRQPDAVARGQRPQRDRLEQLRHRSSSFTGHCFGQPAHIHACSRTRPFTHPPPARTRRSTLGPCRSSRSVPLREDLCRRSCSGLRPVRCWRCSTSAPPIHRLWVTDGNGLRRNVVLGHATAEEYLTSKDFVGGTIGRYANRISGGRFTAGR